jgi:Helix-turn-helix domain
MKKSQKSKILKHLKKGYTLTPYESLKLFSCFRLGGRILELRDEGYNIITTMVKNKHGNRFARYSLEAGK